MGMYTEFIFGCSLSKNTPKVCIDALDYVINGEEKKPKYENPDGWEQKRFNENYIERTTSVEEIEKFIEEYDFYRLFCSCSYYFGAANPTSRFYYDNIDHEYHISTRADLKNYSNAIGKFLDYIKPYVEHGSGFPHKIYAYVQYEEAQFPTIYAMDGIYKDPTYDGAARKLEDRLDKLYASLSKLYQGICYEWNVEDEDYIKHGLKPPTVDEDGDDIDNDTIWDWMIDHIIEKYGEKKKEE